MVPKEQDAGERERITAKEQTLYSGFIAQDVEKAANSIGYSFSAVDAPKNETDLYNLRYEDFVAPLVKAAQELSMQSDQQDVVIACQRLQLLAQEKQISDLLLQIDQAQQLLLETNRDNNTDCNK